MAGGPVIRPDQVLERFSRAAPTYAGEALLQRAMAWRLAQLSRRCSIRRGLWADLGSGTGRPINDTEESHTPLAPPPNSTAATVRSSIECTARDGNGSV